MIISPYFFHYFPIFLAYIRPNREVICVKEQTEQQVETIKMVERALTVLDLLRTSKERLGVNEIAKRCELSHSSSATTAISPGRR